MMKKHLCPGLLLTSFLLGLITISAISAQGQSTDNPIFRHLPPDADKIFHINLPVLMAKTDLPGLLGNIPIKDPSAQQFMEDLKDPSKAGVDIRQGFYVAQTSAPAPDSPGYINIFIPLTDSGIFISQLRRQFPKMHQLHLPGKSRVAGSVKMGIAWNDRLAVVTLVKTTVPKSMDSTGTGDKGAAPIKPAVPAGPAAAYTMQAGRRSLAALQGFDHSFFNTDTQFKADFSDDADFQMWGVQGAGFPSMVNGMMHNSASMNSVMASIKKSGRHSLTEIRFDNGRISFSSKTLLPPDEVAMIAKFDGRPLNTDLLARLPQGNLLGFAALHFDPSAMADVVDKYNTREKIDSMLASSGLKLDNVLRSFKGDFLEAAIAPVRIAGDTGSAAKKPDFYFVITINDTSAMRLISTIVAKKDTSARTQHKNIDLSKIAFTFRDNILVIGAKKTQTDSYFHAGNRQSTGLVTEGVRNNPFDVVIDIKAVAAFLHTIITDSSRKTMQIFTALDKLDRLEITAGGLKGNDVESQFQIIMSDPAKNSLKSLMELMH